MRTPFQDPQWGPFRLGALKILVRAFLVFGLSAGARATAQGLVNVNNRGLTPAQLVTFPDGSPVVGNNFVAQIVYGPDSGSPTNKLGDPMPFRVSTTAFPGTWNPGAASVRTLNGFLPGQVVSMQVWVWDSASFSELGIAQEAYRRIMETGIVSWGCRNGNDVGFSSVFTQVVGTSDDPSSQQLSNFRGFTMNVNTVWIWPGSYISDELGGRWLRTVETTEDASSLTVDLMAIPPRREFPFLENQPVEFPPDAMGDEPIGAAVRRVTTGNPMSLTGPSTGWPLPQVFVPGSTESVALANDQSAVETSLVSVEGTIDRMKVRLKRPFVGRVELEMRYPLQDPPMGGGCRSYPRRIVVDVKPSASRPVSRVSLSPETRSALKLRLESGRSHALQKSYDLTSWQRVADYEVGFPMCVPLSPPNCGTQEDPDDVRRFADFELPLSQWHDPADSRPVFFRVLSR